MSDPIDTPQQQNDEVLSDESSSDEDDLALDGELVRASDEPATKRAKTNDDTSDDDEDVPAAALSVEFVFCDMSERFFHGICQFLNFTNGLVRNSLLADAMIASTVGTVIATSSDQEDEESNGNAYGYASIILPNHDTTKQDADSPSSSCATLIQYCLDHAPKTLDKKLRTLYHPSQTSVGVVSHARMMNLPLELVCVLHQQLLLDLDYAIQHHDEQTDSVIDMRKVSHLIRLAPITEEKGEMFYKFFDDETLADAADASYVVANQSLRVILISLASYRTAVEDLGKMFPAAS